MIQRLLVNVVLLCVVLSVNAQDYTQRLTDSVLSLLSKSKEVNERIFLYLELAKLQVFKPGENKVDLDSATVYIAKASALNNTIKSPAAYGYQAFVQSCIIKESGQEQAGKEMMEKAIQLLIDAKDQVYLPMAYMELSNYYEMRDPTQAPEKIRLLEKATLLFEQSGNTERRAYALKLQAEVYHRQGDPTKAMEKLNLSLAAYNSINYLPLQGVYLLFGDIYHLVPDYRRALDYYLLSLKTAESLHDSTGQLCQINNRIGNIYIALDEKPVAIQFFKNAMQIAEKLNNTNDVLTIAINIANTYNGLSQGKDAVAFLKSMPKKYTTPSDKLLQFVLASIYLASYVTSEQYAEGKPYSEQLIKLNPLHQSLHEKPLLSNSYKVLVNYFLGTKQFSSARTYLMKNQELLLTMTDPFRMSLNYRLWYKLDSAEGNYKAAMYHILAYNKLHDSVYNETKSKQIKEITGHYESEKKENEIKLKDKDIVVLTQKNQLQKSSLAHANFLKNVTIAGIGLLLLIIGLIYRQYRHKQQTTKLVTQKNNQLEHLLTEKEWLLKEVHHRVKNNLHTVICLLESQAAYLENDALKANEISQHRIYAMSLIHQKLYRADDIKTIDMSVYLPEFLNYLADSFGTSQKVRFKLAIDPLKLGVSQAIPVALILNEAVTNSIKYAFPGNTTGIVDVQMHQLDDQIELVIADNGIGMEPVLADLELSSLGLKLMKGLSEDIDGQIIFTNENGTKITLLFPIDPLNENNSILTTSREKELSQ